MDIYEAIRKDHEEIDSLLDRMNTSTQREREELLHSFREEVLPHMEAEEKLIFPALLDRGEKRDTVLEAIEEHVAGRCMLNHINHLSFEDEHWRPAMKVLGEILKHHHEEEEEEVFPIARNILSDIQANELTGSFQQEKDKVRRAMEPVKS